MESESPLSPAAATAWQTIRELATLDGKLIHPCSLHIDNNGTNIYVTGGEGLYMLLKLRVDGWYDDNVESITVRNSKQLFDKELFKKVQPHLPQGAIVEFNGEVIQPGEECEQGGKAQQNGKAKRLKRRKDTEPYNKDVQAQRKEPYNKDVQAQRKEPYNKDVQAQCKEPFECPITHETMLDPVVTIDGHVYERKAIEKWLKTHNTSPVTNLPLEHKTLTPVHTITSRNRQWDPKSFEESDKQKKLDHEAAAQRCAKQPQPQPRATTIVPRPPSGTPPLNPTSTCIVCNRSYTQVSLAHIPRNYVGHEHIPQEGTDTVIICWECAHE
jgi:hypothetical protein